jgi:hypothetical protein
MSLVFPRTPRPLNTNTACEKVLPPKGTYACTSTSAGRSPPIHAYTLCLDRSLPPSNWYIGTRNLRASSNQSTTPLSTLGHVLTFEVPQRNINTSQGAHKDRSSPVKTEPIELLPDVFDVAATHVLLSLPA